MPEQPEPRIFLSLRSTFAGQLAEEDQGELEEECVQAIGEIAARRGLLVRVTRSEPSSGAEPAFHQEIEQRARAALISQVLNVPVEEVARALASANENEWRELLQKGDEQRGKGHCDIPVVT